MSFQWTPHRFSAGALALDVANSVILRFDERRRTDRFAVPAQFDAFAAAASALCAERGAFPDLTPVPPGQRGAFIALREAIDGHFRHRARAGSDDMGLLADLLARLSATFAAHAAPSDTCPVDLATARSALGLVASPDTKRLKICPNCEWLFIDRSKNRSRTWCDMAVCGNRSKARLHYHRQRNGEAK
ncbi:MAG: CGNR zinc finger domain-containing protein [Rhizobium sp.]|nr:CGNR zinc finger domain-containing protein [Rhizobium sp.]MBX9455626.1 CGNR zinc finger domain-containing protein [Rhizobium sp.]